MKVLISKADVLLEALPWLQRFRGRTFVIKYGGSFMDSPDPSGRDGVALDIVFLAAAGINPVVVHGGGKAITRAMEKAGLKASFIQGLRVTDERAARVVEQVLSREINPEIVETIAKHGGKARGFSGTDIFTCRKLPPSGTARGTIGRGIYRRSHARQRRAIAGMPAQRRHSGDQSDRARRGRQALQLQCGRGRGAGGHRPASAAAGFYE